MSELVAALAKAQGEMSHAKFDDENPHFKSAFASLASVIDAIKGPLSANGIAYIQRSLPTEHGMTIETVFYGYGESIETGPVHVPVDKHNAHGYGSALTYAKRYSLPMACGISAEKDDDGNEAVTNSTGRKPQSVTQTVIEQEGIQVDEGLVRDYVTGILAAIANEDGPGLEELLSELDNETKIAVWSQLDSKTRSHIKKREKANA